MKLLWKDFPNFVVSLTILVITGENMKDNVPYQKRNSAKKTSITELVYIWNHFYLYFFPISITAFLKHSIWIK